MLIELGKFSVETKGFVTDMLSDSTTAGGKRLSFVRKID